MDVSGVRASKIYLVETQWLAIAGCPITQNSAPATNFKRLVIYQLLTRDVI